MRFGGGTVFTGLRSKLRYLAIHFLFGDRDFILIVYFSFSAIIGFSGFRAEILQGFCVNFGISTYL